MDEDTKDILTEYYKLNDIVLEFDRKLLTIKGWGVTLSLVAMGLGFQYRQSGFFLVAAISSASFWLLEATVKSHQMRYYPRMREIEVQRSGQDSPRIDWSWARSEEIFTGKIDKIGEPERIKKTPTYHFRYFYVTVMLPHVFTLVVSLLLLALSYSGMLANFNQPESPTEETSTR